MQQHQIPISKNKFLVTESDFAVHMFWRDVELNTIENYKIPKHMTKILLKFWGNCLNSEFFFSSLVALPKIWVNVPERDKMDLSNHLTKIISLLHHYWQKWHPHYRICQQKWCPHSIRLARISFLPCSLTWFLQYPFALSSKWA